MSICWQESTAAMLRGGGAAHNPGTVTKTVNLLVAPLFLLFFMAMFVRRATTFGTWIGGIVSLTVAVLISFWETFFPQSTSISFLWIMPDSFLAGAVTGILASLLPVGRRPIAIEAMVADPQPVDP